MNEWKLEIRKAQNGYVLKGKFNDSDLVQEIIIEEKDIDCPKLEAMKDVLYLVTEYFGIYYSKHNKQNLLIDIEETKDE